MVLISFALGILNVEFFLLFVAVAVLYGVFLSIAAILLEEISFRRYPGWIDLSKLIVFGILENFGYRQMLAFFKVKAFWDVVRRRRAAHEISPGYVPARLATCLVLLFHNQHPQIKSALPQTISDYTKTAAYNSASQMLRNCIRLPWS